MTSVRLPQEGPAVNELQLCAASVRIAYKKCNHTKLTVGNIYLSRKGTVDYFSNPRLRKLWNEAVVVVPSNAPPVTLKVPSLRCLFFIR
mmetsp:Transcript_3345/g.5540  ORF Transcript_3345/g.5540 Transcript_3345/m.5540 type:complete len:89 (+) Transcript_3345:97-363(+)